jgi:hypothetical protein
VVVVCIGKVTREDWGRRNSETYGENKEVSLIVFDYLDSNNDLFIDNNDVPSILAQADANRKIIFYQTLNSVSNDLLLNMVG